MKGEKLESCEPAGEVKFEIPERYRKVFTKEDINILKLRSYQGPIKLVSTLEEMGEALAYLNGDSILGFDTETKPSFKKGITHPPSLLQLAGANNVFLFLLNNLGLPDDLKEILSAKDIVKSGVAVHDDIKELKLVSPFEEAGFVDLGDVAKDLDMKTHGLRNLAANLLGFRISKQARVSNWASEELTHKQIRYAATDAWVSREIYLTMDRLGFLPQT